jgi:hypothetical protein
VIEIAEVRRVPRLNERNASLKMVEATESQKCGYARILSALYTVRTYDPIP